MTGTEQITHKWMDRFLYEGLRPCCREGCDQWSNQPVCDACMKKDHAQTIYMLRGMAVCIIGCFLFDTAFLWRWLPVREIFEAIKHLL